MYRSSWRSRTAATVAGVSAALAAAPASSAAEQWAWPVRGAVITSYSNDNSRPYAGGMHRGIDIAAPVGAGVVAARAGRVTYAGSLGSSGLTLAIETADGRHATSYLHLSSVAVKRGQLVSAGQKVGEVGTSGRRSATEPHLHFGVRRAGRERFYVDPLTVLPPVAGARPRVAAPIAPVAPPLRVQPARVPAAAKPVPAGPRPIPVAAHPRALAHPRTLSPPVVGRAPTLRPVPEGAPIIWGPLVSLAGILLLGAVLARRFTRSDRSRASHGSKRAQPPAPTPAVDVSRLGSVAQVG